MSVEKYDPYNPACPTRRILDRLSNKWSPQIIYALSERPHRFSELLHKIGGISQKMLTQSLRQLEHDHLVLREVMPTVPISVTYSLTALGQSINDPITALRTWAIEHIDEVEA